MKKLLLQKDFIQRGMLLRKQMPIVRNLTNLLFEKDKQTEAALDELYKLKRRLHGK